MKALYLEEYGRLAMREVPTPECKPDEVLLKIKACAICGSDVHGFAGKTQRRIPPVVMGHEASGVIVKTGEQVKKFKEGDRVVFNSSLSCGSCYFCNRGMSNLCTDAKVFGVNCADYHLDGAMAEYLCIPERILYALPDTLDFVQGAMIEPLSIALHAVNRTPIMTDDRAVVIGTGPIGMMLIKVLKNTGASHITAVDIDDSRLQAALEAGADCAYNSQTQDVNALIRKDAPKGADRVFEAVGIHHTLNSALDYVRKGGTVTVVGNAMPNGDIAFQKIVLKELQVIGTYACANEYETALSLMAQNKVAADDILSAVDSLDNAQIWFDKLHNREPGLMKVVLTID